MWHQLKTDGFLQNILMKMVIPKRRPQAERSKDPKNPKVKDSKSKKDSKSSKKEVRESQIKKKIVLNPKGKELSDEQLAEQFLEDLTQLELFEKLIMRYEAKLIRYVRSLGIEQNMAEDVIQDTFIKAYRNFRSFNPKRGKWSSWIYRVAHNVAMDSFKKQKKELTVDEDEWWDSISVPEKISDELNIKINADVLIKGLREIDLKYREPLMLHYLENKGYKEVGEILRLPTATVSTRIKRGKVRLKEALDAQMVGKVNIGETI